jgi:hypothetical protein
MVTLYAALKRRSSTLAQAVPFLMRAILLRIFRHLRDALVIP